MAEKGGKQEKKKTQKRRHAMSAEQLKLYSTRLDQKKVRRMLRSNGAVMAAKFAGAVGQMAYFKSLDKSGVVDRIESASERRARIREERSAEKLEAARARHQAERAAEAAAKIEAEKKAKRSAAAKKAAATRAANKAAKLAGLDEAANAQVASE